MPRRVSDTFKAGMVTDVIGAEGSVRELRDMYVRRSGELCSVAATNQYYATAASASYDRGWSNAIFHPNMGTLGCRGRADATATNVFIDDSDRFQILAAPLQTAEFQELSWSIVSEGSNKDQVPLHAGVATAATAATGLAVEKIIQSCNTGDEVVMAGEIGSLYKWGGSLFNPYNTGTVAIASASASASRIITGTGTSWGANVQEGQYILMDGIAEKANTFQRSYRITKVVSDTVLEIELPIYATAGYTGVAYRIQSLAVIQSPDGVWNGTDERPRQVGICAYHQGKLFTAGVSDNRTAYNTVYDFDSIRWSGTLDENSNGYSHLDLWHNNARISIFPGIGGSIRGLVSMGNELVVVKSHGLFRVTGSSTYDGTGSGLSVQVISTEVGANGFNAWTLTSRGLIIACRDGLYLYDGEQVTSLTDGRVKRWWEANFSHKEYDVVAFEDRVHVSAKWDDFNSNIALVWDSEQNIFFTAQRQWFIAGISTYTDADEWVGDWGFRYYGSNTNNQISVVETGSLTHKHGWNGGTWAPDDTQPPSPAVIFQPVSIGEDPVSEGRVNNVLVHAATYDVNGYTYSFDVGVYSGHSGSYMTGDASTNEHFGQVYACSDDLQNATNDTEDRVYRIPFDDMDAAPSVSIVIEVDGSNSADAYYGFRIYAVGVDYEHSNVVS